MPSANQKILLIDLDDSRRDTRVKVLKAAGYDVDLRSDFVEAEFLDHEGSYDLIVLSVPMLPMGAIEYSDRVATSRPTLPILLLTDGGVFVPRGTLSRQMETGHPVELLTTIAIMLAGSSHIREVPPVWPQ